MSADIPEQNVSLTKPELSPIQRVTEAMNCLPASLESTLTGDVPSGYKRWTIRDFHRAYATGEATPLMVLNSSCFLFILFSGTGTGFMQNLDGSETDVYAVYTYILFYVNPK